VAGDFEVPIIFQDLLVEIGDAFLGALEAFVRANDADVIPHGTTDFVPVVGDDNHFVGVVRVARMPGWNCKIADAGFIANDAFGGAMSTDQSFEQGVAGEAIGSMQTSAGDFPDCIKAADVSFAVDGGENATALIMCGGHDWNGLF